MRFSALSMAAGPKGLSSAAYEQTQKAAAALERANEYRDKSEEFYEPRYLDAERAIDDVPSSSDVLAPDSKAAGRRV